MVTSSTLASQRVTSKKANLLRMVVTSMDSVKKSVQMDLINKNTMKTKKLMKVIQWKMMFHNKT